MASHKENEGRGKSAIASMTVERILSPISPPIHAGSLTPPPERALLPSSSSSSQVHHQTPNVKSASELADLKAVRNVLSSMKLSISVMGHTFDALSHHAATLALLAPAIDAVHQIHAVREEVDSQCMKQEADIADIKASFGEEFRRRITQNFLARSTELIREVVAIEVKARVERELVRRGLRDRLDKIRRNQRRLHEAQTMLYNFEARRHNGTLRSDSTEEPLRPLLRPLAIPPSGLDEKMIVNGNAHDGHAHGSPNRGLMLEVGHPSPSPSFPPTIHRLLELDTETVRRLVKEYGLVVEDRTDKTKRSDEDESDDKEELTNRFMEHIGVGLKFIPPSPISARANRSPLRRLPRIVTSAIPAGLRSASARTAT